MTHSIGGLFGLGATKFTAEAVFEKNEFYSNEKMRVKLTIDNTECKKAIKSIKLRLYRSWMVRAPGQPRVFPCTTTFEGTEASMQSYIKTFKFDGCKAHEK